MTQTVRMATDLPVHRTVIRSATTLPRDVTAAPPAPHGGTRIGPAVNGATETINVSMGPLRSATCRNQTAVITANETKTVHQVNCKFVTVL